MHTRAFTHLHPTLLPHPAHFRSIYLKPPPPGYFTFISNLRWCALNLNLLIASLLSVYIAFYKTFKHSGSLSISSPAPTSHLKTSFQNYWCSCPTPDWLVFRTSLHHHLGNFIHYFPVKLPHFQSSVPFTILVISLTSLESILQLLRKKECLGGQFLRLCLSETSSLYSDPDW